MLFIKISKLKCK